MNLRAERRFDALADLIGAPGGRRFDDQARRVQFEPRDDRCI